MSSRPRCAGREIPFFVFEVVNVRLAKAPKHRQGGCGKRVGNHHELGRVGFALEKGPAAYLCRSKQRESS